MNNFYLQNGLERLERLKMIIPNFNYEKWYFSSVLDLPNLENHQFYTDSYKPSTIDLLNVNNINGASHCDYNNKMWIEMLGALKRFDSKKNDIESMLDFISTSNQVKNLNKYGNYYLIGEGNHRFCIAKFLNIDIPNVSVTEYEFNDKYFDRYNDLKRRDIHVNGKCDNFWKLKIHDSDVKINENLISDFIKTYDSIQLKESIIEKLFFKEKKYIISSTSDLKKASIASLIKKNKERRKQMTL